jgi:tetratricopeptide (TPR) repeat protein
VVETNRTEQAEELTQAGTVLGTYAYMPPEQARGEVGRLDRRCDVFGLGAILCEVLTGQPPYQGTWEELKAQAQVGHSGPARERLVACGADEELVRVAGSCLGARPEDRPADAAAVAVKVAAYQAGVRERLRRAELERAAAAARAVEERKRRRVLLGLAAAVLGLVVAVAGGGLLVQHQAAKRRFEAAEHSAELARREAQQRQVIESALDNAVTLRQQARWREAQAVLGQARQELGESGPDDLRRRLDVADAELALVNRLDAIRLRRATLVEGKMDFLTAARDYAAAFQKAGLGQIGDDESAVAARVRASGVRGPLVAALDDWALVVKEPGSRSWLLRVAQQAAQDSWGEHFRDPAVWKDRGKLRAVAEDALRDDGAKLGELSPQVLVSLGWLLCLGDRADAVPLLRAAQRRHPNDFWLNFGLGYALSGAKNSEEAIGYYRAAVVLRPDANAARYNLGLLLAAKEDWDGAIAEYRKAIEIDANDALGHSTLGIALRANKDVDGAIAEQRQALALDFNSAIVHNNLGNALLDNKDVNGAITEFYQAIKLDPNYAAPHNNLGNALLDNKDVNGAIAEYRKATKLDSKDASAYSNLGDALLDNKKDANEAIAPYRTAAELDPKDAKVHYNLGRALLANKDVNEAIAELRQAIKLRPNYAKAHHNLGLALRDKGQLDEAIQEYYTAIEIDPEEARTHYNLGRALAAKKDWGEAIAEYRKALAIDTQHAYSHGALGVALLQQGRFAEAGVETRQSLGLLPQGDPMRQVASRQLKQCEYLAGLDEKLSPVLGGNAEPAGAAECLALAQLCQVFKRRHAAAATFYAAAFAADPRLTTDLRQPNRQNAACSAALAAAGQGEDARSLPDKVRLRLRRQALAWLRDDLAACRKLAQSQEPAGKQAAREKLRQWKEVADLASVRDPESLAKLPDDERQDWRRLWDDVYQLLWDLEVPK